MTGASHNPYQQPRRMPARPASSFGVSDLGAADCWAYLRRTPMGRLATCGAGGAPDVFPMNYLVHDGSLYLRSAPGTKLRSILDHAVVAFEVDGHDHGQWWSVVVHGTARRLDADDEIEASGILELESWSPTPKDDFLRVVPASVTGRRFGDVRAPQRAPATMRVWATGDAAGELLATTRPVPAPAADEVLVAVEACGVCRTDLHIIDREIPVHRAGVVPGHQVVGIVEEAGPEVRGLHPGDRVGVAWLRRTCGVCRWCRDGAENLCQASLYNGWDADGGFADYLTAPEAFVYPLPGEVDPVEVAPLLCAGIIGYRALSRANVPPGGRLGVYGFGSSAHLTAQVAIAQGMQVLAMTRGEGNRDLARRLGAVFVGDATTPPPEPVDAAIVFAPAGEIVPAALQATRPCGTVVLAGIHMSDIPALDYTRHLFQERDLRTVTANTRADGAALLRLAHTLSLAPAVTRYAFADTGRAVDDLRSGRAAGSLVIAH